MFEEPATLLLGLVSGIVFGFLLQKGQVADHEAIVGAFLLREFAAIKILMTAVLVGSIGVVALVTAGLAAWVIHPLQLPGILIAAILFGTGIVFLGYCPGTSIVAASQGHRDAMAGILGMLVGAALYVVGYPWLVTLSTMWADFGKEALPQLTDTSPWLWVLGYSMFAFAVLSWLTKLERDDRERTERRQSGQQPAAWL